MTYWDIRLSVEGSTAGTPLGKNFHMRTRFAHALPQGVRSILTERGMTHEASRSQSIATHAVDSSAAIERPRAPSLSSP